MLSTMNSSPAADVLLQELHDAKVKELTPLFVILGFLMLYGLLGNTSILLCMSPIAKQSISSFFIQILAILDILVCLTISFTLFNYSKIYMFTNEVVCKMYVFSKFTSALFSGYVLLVVAAYRYRKICHPLKKQLSLRSAKIAIGAGIFVVVIVTAPQLYLIDTVEMEVQNDYNVTLIGSDCVTKALDNTGLKPFSTAWDGFCLVCFIVSSMTMVVSYVLQARAIVKFNKNRVKLRQNSSGSFSEYTDVDDPRGVGRNSDVRPGSISVLAVRQTNQCKVDKQTGAQNQTMDKSGLVSMVKVTIMFSIISLGFILTFLPYLMYAIWRNFQAVKEDFPHSTEAHHLFVLNSYIINSLINPVVIPPIIRDQS